MWPAAALTTTACPFKPDTPANFRPVAHGELSLAPFLAGRIRPAPFDAPPVPSALLGPDNEVIEAGIEEGILARLQDLPDPAASVGQIDQVDLT
jgi:hypothetical protein